MDEFLRKFDNRAIKSGRDKSILITKIYQLTVIYLNKFYNSQLCLNPSECLQQRFQNNSQLCLNPSECLQQRFQNYIIS